LKTGSTDNGIDRVARGLGLITSNAFLEASAIDLEDSKFWQDASDNPFRWPESRRKAWQKAVERRTSWLYETLYNTLGYKAWLLLAPSTNVIEEGSMRVTADEEIDNGGEKTNG
jgi:hypothetical protein